MAVTDHSGGTPSVVELEALYAEVPEPIEPVEWSRPALVLLAVLSAAAGAIHLAMTPAHASEWMAEGVAFAAVGWFQIGTAALLLTRPSRPALTITALANVAFVGAWAITRVWGPPFGPEAGVAHDASFVDVACVVFEVLLVVGALALFARPGLGARLSDALKVPLSIVPLAVVVVATMAMTSTSATSHGHSEAGEVAAGGHTHSHGEGSTEDDKGLSLIMNGAGEGGGHVHDDSVVDLDASTQATLDAQLAQMQPFIDKYPTVAAAEAAGYHRQGPYSPGLGAHYAEAGRPNISTGPTMTDEALQHPMLIFDGVDPDSKLAGFMYMVFSLDTQNPPEGFAGPNDHWHYHTNVCIKFNPDGSTDAPLGADTSAPQELCDQYGGHVIANTGYMLHVWPVPGYDSPQGMFSNLNSRLACPDGTYYVIPPDQIGAKRNICKDVNA